MITYKVSGWKHEPGELPNYSAEASSPVFHTIEEAKAWKAKNDAAQKAHLRKHHMPLWHYQAAYIIARGTIEELLEAYPLAVIDLRQFEHRKTFKGFLHTPAEYHADAYPYGEIQPLDW